MPERWATDHRLCFHSQGPEQTLEAGEFLSRAWRRGGEQGAEQGSAQQRAGLTISLRGELGAGKTVFVKGLARGLGIGEELVSSPTFVLANEYPASVDGLVLHHVDFYRLETAEELEPMGFFDLMGQNVLLAVEWGPRFSQELPLDRIDLTIEGDTESTPAGRRVTAWGTGHQTWRLLSEWRRRLAAGGRKIRVEAGNADQANA